MLSIIVIAICVAATSVNGRITRISDDVTAPVGTPVTLQCVTNSSRPINWDFHALQLHAETVHVVYNGLLAGHYQSNTRYSAWIDHGTYDLTINNTQLEDSGTYICIENGGMGPGVEAVRLTVTRKAAVIVKSTRRSTTTTTTTPAATDQEVVSSKMMLEDVADSFVEEMKFGVNSTSAASGVHGLPGQSASDDAVAVETVVPVADTTQQLVTQQRLSQDIEKTLSAAHDTASQSPVAVAEASMSDANKSAALDDAGSGAADTGDSVAESVVEDLHKILTSDESDDANTAATLTAGHLMGGRCMTLVVSSCVSLLFNLLAK